MRRMIARLALILFGLVLGLALVELGVRALHFEKDTFWQPHELYGWSLIPNREGWWFSNEFQIKVKINPKGLRNRETQYAKPAGVTRILVLGDSMTEAIQVPMEATFSANLESLLNKSAGESKFEVINTGVAHYGTANELLFFRHEGFKYQPDVVILAFLTTNDVMNNSHELGGDSPYFVLNADGQLELKDFPLPKDPSVLSQTKLFLGANFQLYNLTSRTIRTQAPSLQRSLQSIGIMRRQAGSDNAADIPTDFFVYAPKYDSKWENAWAITRKLILQLKQEVESRKAKFLVVVLSPQFVHIRDENWQDYLNAIPAMKTLEWDVDKPDRLIVEFLKEQNIPYLHTTPYFQTEAQQTKQLLYFLADGHLNVAGHQLAARLIYDQLIRLNYFLK